MKYNIINSNELRTAYPVQWFLYNPQTKKEEIDEFVTLYNKYRYMFTQYILSKTDLKDIDNEISMQKHIQPLHKTEMDIYQYCVSDELKYLYIRNNMYVQKLKKSEKEFLKSVELHEGKLNIKENAFIERTFTRVIAEADGDRNILTNFGNQNIAFIKPCNSVVIGLRYNVENPNDLKQVLDADNFIKLILLKINLVEGEKLKVPIVGKEYTIFEVNVMPTEREEEENERD